VHGGFQESKTCAADVQDSQLKKKSRSSALHLNDAAWRNIEPMNTTREDVSLRDKAMDKDSWKKYSSLIHLVR